MVRIDRVVVSPRSDETPLFEGFSAPTSQYKDCWKCKCPTEPDKLDDDGNCAYCREEVGMELGELTKCCAVCGKSTVERSSDYCSRHRPGYADNAGVTSEGFHRSDASAEDLWRMEARHEELERQRWRIIHDQEEEIKSLKHEIAPPPPRHPYDPEAKQYNCEGCGCRVSSKKAKVVPMVPEGISDAENQSYIPYTFCSNKCVGSYLRGGGRVHSIGGLYSIDYDGSWHHYIEEVSKRDAVPVIHNNRLHLVAEEVSNLVMFTTGGVGILVLMALAAIVSHFIW
jgi:hypothetical protein